MTRSKRFLPQAYTLLYFQDSASSLHKVNARSLVIRYKLIPNDTATVCTDQVPMKHRRGGGGRVPLSQAYPQLMHKLRNSSQVSVVWSAASNNLPPHPPPDNKLRFVAGLYLPASFEMTTRALFGNRAVIPLGGGGQITVN